jgi:PAS domain S-box-containing protein
MGSALPSWVLTWLVHRDRKLSLRLVLVVPFVLEITAVVGLTGYLSFRNGQDSIDKIAALLRDEMTLRVVQYLDSYLATPILINRINADAVRLGHLDLTEPEQLEQHLITQLQQFTTVSHILVGTEQGTLRITNRSPRRSILRSDPIDPSQITLYALDSQGNSTDVLNVLKFDVRQRPWYQQAVQSGQPVRIPVFRLADGSDFSLNASYPVYDRDGNLQGVFSAASDLSYLKQFLTHLKVGRSGRAFMVERNGLLIGTSSTEQLQVRQPRAFQSSGLNRFQAVDSEDPLIRSTSRYLISCFGSFNQIQSNQRLTFISDDDRQFVQVVPYRDEIGLDWLIVVVVPEADFMAEINQNNQMTLLLCLLALVCAIGLGLLTAAWIARPILRLSRVSQSMALGDWELPAYTESAVAELNVLSRSFHQMSEHLQSSFDQAKSALWESESKFNQIFHSSSTPIAIVDLEGQFLQVNAACSEMLGYPSLEFLNLRLEQIIHPDERENSLECLRQAQVGGFSSLSTTRYLHQDQTIRSGLANFFLVHDRDLVPLYFVFQIQPWDDRIGSRE